MYLKVFTACAQIGDAYRTLDSPYLIIQRSTFPDRRFGIWNEPCQGSHRLLCFCAGFSHMGHVVTFIIEFYTEVFCPRLRPRGDSTQLMVDPLFP